MKQWYGICGETIEDVKNFGTILPAHFNLDYLENAETPEEAFKKYYTRKVKLLEKQLEKAKKLAFWTLK